VARYSTPRRGKTGWRKAECSSTVASRGSAIGGRTGENVMSDQQIGLLVLFALSVACALVAHALIRSYWVATASAAAAVALLFHLFARSSWEQMFLYAWATGAVAGLAAALLVGLAFRRFRGRTTAD